MPLVVPLVTALFDRLRRLHLRQLPLNLRETLLVTLQLVVLSTQETHNTAAIQHLLELKEENTIQLQYSTYYN